LGIPYVAIIGDDEMRDQIFSLKNLETGIQQKLSLEELINTIQS
jgi:histidyl-tRNA synthetase